MSLKRIVALCSFMTIVVPFFAFASIDADLRYGERGSAVQELQEFLIKKGHLEGEATGNFYSLTLAAVKAYQVERGLPATGFVGPLTRKAMRDESAEGVVPGVLPISSFLTQQDALPQSASPAISSSVSDLKARLATLQKMLEFLKSSAGTQAASAPALSVPVAPFDFKPQWRDAVVNILCRSRYGNFDDVVSGSGVIVDPRGIILTNAHVAQAFLFSEWPNPSLYQCSIRTDSPASPKYLASLLYIPDAWVQADLQNSFKSEDLTVYGAHDFALLVITGPTSSSVPMPHPFPYLPIHTNGALGVKTPVYLSGYAAEFLSADILERNLYQLSSPSSVYAQRSIASSSKPDVIAMSGNIAAQHGSSGGAVIGPGGVVAGILTFLDKDSSQSTGDRVINAITSDYIARDFQAATGRSLTDYITDPDPAGLSKKYLAEVGAQYQKKYAELWQGKGFIVPGYSQ